jgi:5-methylcytosine-specific restriction endonuclease McrA
MAEIVCYEAYPTLHSIRRMRRVLVGRHGFSEKQNQYGSYFYLETPSMDSWQIKTVMKFHKYKYRSYNKRYERGSNYRAEFFKHNKGPHRCVYCGKRLKSTDIEVDHLIPVSKAKSSIGARVWLRICGIFNVNDHRNLVASCKRCNRKKSDKIGFWVLRGLIGRFDAFWTIRNIVVILLVIVAAVMVLLNISFIRALLTYILSLIR